MQLLASWKKEERKSIGFKRYEKSDGEIFGKDGLEDAIFVKQYMIQLPSEDEIREALERYLQTK